MGTNTQQEEITSAIVVWKQPIFPLERLYDDIIIEIFLLLPIRDIGSCLRLNKYMNNLLSLNSYWVRRLKKNVKNAKLVFEYEHYINFLKDKSIIKTKNDRIRVNVKLYILQFALYDRRDKMLFHCSNSYHRMLVHQYCDLMNLYHIKVRTGQKRGRVCHQCNSYNITSKKIYTCLKTLIIFYCKNCGTDVTKKCKYNEDGTMMLIPSYGVLIFK